MIPPTALPVAPLPANPAAAAAPATVRVDAFQPGTQQQPGNAMGQSFNNAIDGFSSRSQAMQNTMREIAAGGGPANVGASGNSMTLSRPPAQQASPVPGTAPVGQPGSIQSSMSLMVDSFNFAIEASLVSRAATQFTGAVSTLMKGQ